MENENAVKKNCKDKLLSKQDLKDSTTCAQDNGLRLCCGKVIKPETLLFALTVAGVVLGIILGVSLLPLQPSEDAITLIMFPGEILMRLLKQLIIPIVVASIITGVAGLNSGNSGKIATHAMIYYMSTTVIAVLLGVALVVVIQPGQIPNDHSGQGQENQKIISVRDTFLDLVRNIFPGNIIAACFQVDHTSVSSIAVQNGTANGSSENVVSVQMLKKTTEKVQSTNVLGLITFAIFFGTIAARLGKEAEVVTRFFEALNKIFLKMIAVVIWYSPIGICSLIAGNVLKMQGFEILFEKLGLYIVAVVSGLAVHGMIILPTIYWVFTRKNPITLYRGSAQAWLTAVGTGSSAGTLPVTIRCLENNLKVDPRIARFVLPLGATINMDGTALLEAVAAITIAQMNGLSLNIGQIITISITATTASIGAAAVPGSGLVTLVLVLSAIGVPTDLVAILWSIDWFIDRLRTSVNVLGDCVGASIINHINRDILEDPDVSGADVESGSGERLIDAASSDSGLSLERRESPPSSCETFTVVAEGGRL